eukprot:scaffold217378_cov33-Tisochrysis_lutea.AAC.3
MQPTAHLRSAKARARAAAHAHIHCLGVGGGSQHDLGSAIPASKARASVSNAYYARRLIRSRRGRAGIPSRSNVVGQHGRRLFALFERTERACKAEIGNLAQALLVEQQVGRFEIPVQQVRLVANLESLEHLVQDELLVHGLKDVGADHSVQCAERRWHSATGARAQRPNEKELARRIGRNELDGKAASPGSEVC